MGTPVPATDLPSSKAVPAYDLPGATSPDPAAPEKPEEPSFPYDKPGTEYGSVLPFARNTTTGKTSLAIPEMIRSPVRGAIDMGKDLMGKGRPVGTQTLTPDEMAAVTSMGGVRLAPTVSRATLPPAKVMPKYVTDANEAGYVLPPAMAGKPGMLTSALSGWGGKIKLQQSASVKNQEVTNGLAAKALDLPEDTTLNHSVFEKVRADAGKAYDEVEKSVPYIFPDGQFLDSVKGLGGQSSEAARFFPKVMDNPGIKAVSDELSSVHYFSPRAGLEVVKELRFNGNANLKIPGDPMRHALGLAQRQAADYIDALMDRQIEAAAYGGKDLEAAMDPSLIPRYKAARKQIAKSYDIEAVTNETTGDVNALGLGKFASKGRPMTGELDTIARAANAFPRAMQPVARFGGDESHSALDFFGSAAAIAHGNPSVAGAIMGRPMARSRLLSQTVQNRLMGNRMREPMRPTLPQAVPGIVAGPEPEE